MLTGLLIAVILDAIHGVKHNLEFMTFACSSDKQSLSLNLKAHSKLMITGAFSAAFWFKYKPAKNVPFITIDTFDGSLPFLIDERRKIKVGSTITTLDELLPGSHLNDFRMTTFQGNWYYFVMSIKTDGTKVKKLTMNLSLNYKTQEVLIVEKNLDLRHLFLVLGASQKYSNCELEALYYQFYLFDSSIDFTDINLPLLSSGLSEPIFMNKFSIESSYNKFYSNMISSGIGDIRNGAESSTFLLFSSLSSNNNYIGRQTNLVNDLGVFFLPEKLLPSYQVNSSYVFLIQYDFYYKDYAQASFDNLYYHVLYQRMPANGVNRLIRLDLQMVMNPNDAYAYLRYTVNDKVEKQTPYLLTLERSQGLRNVPFNYNIVRVIQTALNPNPEILFINGYDDTKYSIKRNFLLLQSDQHIVGDFNQDDATRREFLSFISINEVSFFLGAYIIEEKLKNSPVSYYSGLDKQLIILTCKTTNNPVRLNLSNNAVFDTCDEFKKDSNLIRMY